jgi:hypothetical protein
LRICAFFGNPRVGIPKLVCHKKLLKTVKTIFLVFESMWRQ